MEELREKAISELDKELKQWEVMSLYKDPDRHYIAHRLYQAGYRKVSGEPPVLSNEEMRKVVDEWVNENFSVRCISLNRGHWEDIVPVIAQAQRDADMRFYNKET